MFLKTAGQDETKNSFARWDENLVPFCPVSVTSQYEKIAIIKQAVVITSKFPPRNIQLLSLLILLNSENGMGRLCPINTGEGKTTIVAMLAAIKALDGHKVDIVTSSPELAKPQAEQPKSFYDKFDLTVSHNGKCEIEIKEQYKADIVYGAASDFQGDISRDEYSKLGTRSDRKCDVAIVDEVDSMLIDETKEEFIKKCTITHIKKLLRVTENLSDNDKIISNDYPEIKIPKHLRELVMDVQLTKWIDSAIHAKYRCKNEQHYIVKDGKIAPVDANNTGIVQQNMHWSNGLYQFLQIKHGAKITAESLTTNFISNVTYFRRYGSNIYGLTWKQKQYQELMPIITKTEENWYTNIVESSINKLINGQGVLIITKYINEVDEIKNRLIKAEYDITKIKTYRTEIDSKIIEEELKPGEIIIATNIAGRGTDIRAEKIEKNGGLHVCVTFLPPNERVEQQNVGRTSRTGNKGIGQFILLETTENDFEILKQIRDKQEEDGIHKAETEIEKVTIKDTIFAEFCKLLTEINQTNIPHIKHKIRAVEDRFDKENDKLIENPHFYVLIGNDLLKEKKNNEAIEEFRKAIEIDKHFQVNAFYNRGYARIAQYGSNMNKYETEITEAINDFKQAKQIIEDNLESMLNIFQLAANSEVLSEQVSNKLTLYGIQKNTIEMAIGVGSIDEELKGLENRKKQKDITQNDIQAIDNEIKCLEDNKKAIGDGAIGEAINKKRNIEIEFLEIEKSLPEDQKIELYKDEISEYKNNGFRGNFKITEIKPIPWSKVICLALIGLAQIIIGGALAVFILGVGSTIGMGLISEGISDIIIAVKDGIINRDFSWASYAIQKAISLTVSIVCAGLGAIKDVAKTAIAGVKAATTAITVTVKEGCKIAARAVGTALAKGVAKELVTALTDYGVNKALMPSKLDGQYRNNHYEKLIKDKAMELLNPQSESKHALLTITEGIAKGIATNKISGLSSVLQINEARLALDELDKFLPNFINNLNKEIEKLYKEQNVQKKIDDLNKKQRQQQQTNVQQNTTTVNKRNTIKEETNGNYTSDFVVEKSKKDIDIYIEQNEEKMKFERENKTPEGLRKSLALSVSTNMCNIIKNKLTLWGRVT
ncbi:unnamed protein product, partial [Didymodactylos carnosus]